MDHRVNDNIELQGERFGRYEIEVLTPPPDEALNTDPETGGKIGFANIFAYDDPRGEGPLNLSDYEPEEYSELLYRMRGGSPDVMLAYAKDSFAEGTNIATQLGTAVEPGFFLVRFSGDCTCPFSDEPCQDPDGNICDVRSTITVIPTDTSVDLTIVDDISTFSAYHTPDWLFLSSGPDPRDGTEVTDAFLSSYAGTFTNEVGEAMTLGEDGFYQRLWKRQVGSDGGSVPYPTICSWTETGSVISVIERSDAAKAAYAPTATHLIRVQTTELALSDALEPTTTANANCQLFMQQERQRLPFGDDEYVEVVSTDLLRVDGHDLVRQ